MSRSEEMFLQDIILCCEKISGYTENITFEQFLKDGKTYDAVVRNLEIIGEAAKNITDETRGRIPSIPWRNIAGMRDFITHVYFGIDNDILWDVIQNKMPVLSSRISTFLKEK